MIQAPDLRFCKVHGMFILCKTRVKFPFGAGFIRFELGLLILKLFIEAIILLKLNNIYKTSHNKNMLDFL